MVWICTAAVQVVWMRLSGQMPGRGLIGDPVSDVLYASRAFGPGGVVLHGHFSAIGLPHPGPAMLWILGAGWHAAPVFGLSPAAGAYLLYALACSAVLVAGAGLAAAATGRVWFGAAFLVLVTSTVTVDGAFLGLWAPRFVALLIVLLVAASLAVAARHPAGPVALSIVGALLAQVYLETVVIGAVAMLVAVVLTWRAKRLVRALVAAPVIWVVAIAVGRLSTEGLSLPVRYVELALEHRGQYTPDLASVVSGASYGGAVVLFGAAAGAAGLVWRRWPARWRRWPVLFVPAALVLHFGIAYTGTHGGQALLLGAALPTALTVAGAALVGAQRRTGRGWVWICRVVTVGLLALAAVQLRDAQQQATGVWRATTETTPEFDISWFDGGARGGPVLLAVRADSAAIPQLEAFVFPPALLYAHERGVAVCTVPSRAITHGRVPSWLACGTTRPVVAAVAMRSDEVPSGLGFEPVVVRDGVTLGLAWTSDIDGALRLAGPDVPGIALSR